MAMDRTMYGKVEPGGTYQPYRITVKKGSPPGCKFLKWGIRPANVGFSLQKLIDDLIVQHCSFLLTRDASPIA